MMSKAVASLSENRAETFVTQENTILPSIEGILLLDKPKGITSFGLVYQLRRLTGVQKIGHTGTLDPFATGVMVMLIGKKYTRLSQDLVADDKEYIARLRLGITTDTYDHEGQETATSDLVPSIESLHEILSNFQGTIHQVPPMFSAKKVKGQKLYHLARKGVEIERAPVMIQVEIELLSYEYPYIDLRVACSKGTYVRSLAHDIGAQLGCGAHLEELRRTRCGRYTIENALEVPSLSCETLLPRLLAQTTS